MKFKDALLNLIQEEAQRKINFSSFSIKRIERITRCSKIEASACGAIQAGHGNGKSRTAARRNYNVKMHSESAPEVCRSAS